MQNVFERQGLELSNREDSLQNGNSFLSQPNKSFGGRGSLNGLRAVRRQTLMSY